MFHVTHILIYKYYKIIDVGNRGWVVVQNLLENA